MDAQQLVSEFLGSDHGAQALQALTSQGLSDADAQQVLTHAAGAAADHATADAAPSGGHTGSSFLAGFAAGLARGDGFLKSLVDGGEGILGGHMAEAIAARAGIDPATASTLAAAVSPYVVGFLKQRLA